MNRWRDATFVARLMSEMTDLINSITALITEVVAVWVLVHGILKKSASNKSLQSDASMPLT